MEHLKGNLTDLTHADLIKKAMVRKEINGAMLGQYANISRAMIYKIINLERTMTALHAKRIAHALKTVTAEQLLIAQVRYQLSK